MDTASRTTRKVAASRRLNSAAQWAAWQALWDKLLLPDAVDVADAAQPPTTIGAAAPTSGERPCARIGEHTSERAQAGGGGTA